MTTRDRRPQRKTMGSAMVDPLRTVMVIAVVLLVMSGSEVVDAALPTK